MKMRKRKLDRFHYFLSLMAIIILLPLSGCANPSQWTWQHPDKKEDLQLLQDKRECRRLAEDEVAKIDYFYSYNFYDFHYPHLHQRNSFYWPYSHGYGHDSFYQQRADLENFFWICMKAKGWQRTRIESDGQ